LLPIPFLDSLKGLPGFDLESFVAVHELQEQVTSLRLNPAKQINKQAHSFLKDAFPIPWCREGYYLQERPSFVTDPLWHAGAYYVQEASSMFVQFILQQIIPTPAHELVLDLCAAPGGKTTLLASYFKDGLVVANETIKQRNAVLVENTTKWGSDHIVVTQNDPSHFKSLPHFFDVMVVDAPCSGSGLFRKDPSAIEEWSLDSVQHCSTRQSRILEESIVTLKEGGFLIYSTCSYSFEEDEKMLDQIAALPGMKAISVQVPSEWGIVPCESPIHHASGYRFYPNKLKGEGFFIAVFQKEQSIPAGYYTDALKWTLSTKKELELVGSFFALPDHYEYIQHQGAMLAFAKKMAASLQALLDNLYVKKMGLTLGEIKGKDFVPSHALAMSSWEQLPYNTLEIDHETALQYLRRADLVLSGEKGWNLITYQNIRLGWAKLLPNRTNNYYPNEWRILKF
jgi:16S rRNA C967 or C1407 C5-methylase (RsmB/RsmF family)/NOL1/NOP2/fmu family ribosome biogenesis protein